MGVGEPRRALASIKLLTMIEVVALLIGLVRARAVQQLTSYQLTFAHIERGLGML